MIPYIFPKHICKALCTNVWVETWDEVVVELEERSLPIPEICSLHPGHPSSASPSSLNSFHIFRTTLLLTWKEENILTLEMTEHSSNKKLQKMQNQSEFIMRKKMLRLRQEIIKPSGTSLTCFMVILIQLWPLNSEITT